MVYFNVRQTVSDYAAWRKIFDQDEGRRKAAGATGAQQVYRDTDNPNVITLTLEWDSAENARKFGADPALREVMQKAGVVGAPAVMAITTRT